jgi:hypothetical protein
MNRKKLQCGQRQKSTPPEQGAGGVESSYDQSVAATVDWRNAVFSERSTVQSSM